MAAGQNVQFWADRISPASPEYQAILAWPFPSQPFYVGQVRRLLQNDIPFRLSLRTCAMFAYRDQSDVFGFGTLDVSCDHYANKFTGGLSHCYIPLLAVHPDPRFQRKGHGSRIVQHLESAAFMCIAAYASAGERFSNDLFLDVYTANTAAIALYQKRGFHILNPNNPIPDPDENSEPYFVMAKRLPVFHNSDPTERTAETPT